MEKQVRRRQQHVLAIDLTIKLSLAEIIFDYVEENHRSHDETNTCATLLDYDQESLSDV